MRAYDLATTPDPWRDKSQDAVWNFIRFVRETNDPDIRGLVAIMVEEVQGHWINGIC